MKPIWKFRLFALLVFVFVGGMSISNLVAEFLRTSYFSAKVENFHRTGPGPG